MGDRDTERPDEQQWRQHPVQDLAEQRALVSGLLALFLGLFKAISKAADGHDPDATRLNFLRKRWT